MTLDGIPNTPRGRRYFQMSIVGGGTIGGLLLAVDASHQWGYVATYSAAFAALNGSFCLLVGLVLLIWRNTRWVGLSLTSGAILFYLSFVGMTMAFAHFGVWSHEPMVHFGPDVPADVVVLLRDDLDEAALNKALNALADRGSNNKSVGQVMIVYVGKHQGYAFTFVPRATPEQRKAFRAEVMRADMVWRVYDNIAPAQIKIEEKKR